MSSIFDYDKSKFEDNHSFLAEELLVPNVDKADGSRVNMFDSHLIQHLTLLETDFPKVFTNFENQFGKYSRAYKRTDKDLILHKRLYKNDYNSVVIFIDEDDNKVSIEKIESSKRVTENYGYKLQNDGINKYDDGDSITKDELLYKSTAYDDQLNFGYGKNLKAVYMPWHNMTFEDALILSQSAADSLKSYSIEEVEVSINTNDMPLNLYGDAENYASFPDIGEKVEDKIAIARRRINKSSILYSGKAKNLSKVNFNSDVPFYSDGVVTDIEIYCNNEEDISKYEYYSQLNKYYESNKAYYNSVVDELEKLSEDYELSEDALYLKKRYSEMVDSTVSFRKESNIFDNIIIKFKIEKVTPVSIGFKLSGRYGNKGVVSDILPDEEMPTNEYGEHADIILNPLGVINRLNPAQLVSQELCFASNQAVRQLQKMWDDGDMDAMTDLYFDFMHDVNSEQCSSLIDYYNELEGNDELVEFWSSILEEGIFIHQAPFYGNMTLDKMRDIYKKYDFIKPYNMTVKNKGKDVDVEMPIVMGEMYFMVLKHKPITKFSARATGQVSLKDMPTKGMSYKDNRSLYNNNSVRIGEMEYTNLQLCNRDDIVNKFMQLYSVSPEARRIMTEKLLTTNIFNIGSIDLPDDIGVKTKEIFKIFLNHLFLDVVPTNNEDN